MDPPIHEMRPLPSPPAMKFPDTIWPQERLPQTTVTNTYVLRLPIGRKPPTTSCVGPRPPRARSPASSTCSITSADFWAPLTDSEPDTPPTSDDEAFDAPPPVAAPNPRKKRTKPANIVIPKTITQLPATSALSPLSPLSPALNNNSPNARVRKLAKLTRTLGENVPVELVFPSSTASGSHLMTSPTSPIHFARASREPSTPTPARRSPGTTAVGLHYALGLHAPKPAKQPLTTTASPPPFTNVFTMDSQSWDRARTAVLNPPKTKNKSKFRIQAMLPKVDNGRGTWRKKENTWSGEWNVEDMQELQLRLRRLR
ncbi:hypothetical protein MIND_01293000 [Mycena indigotica]|uniref:Uncharacterized protein n=1 Tax=Mycena indigotica TaxID=2126181 RepID=A0A8H6S1X5_9AGAR|nr:uncharacterized protein MIND_01293000 [Mycena indigotica]KAF7290531.1 hypothetical protein MIND_01293000 [Mycena indigotica]